MSYQRYGFTSNPYQTSVLKCHLNRTDAHQFLALHPAIEEKQLAKDIWDSIQLHQPVFYVVVGTSGSGRTVTANRIFRLYNGLRERHARRNKLPPPKVAPYERKHDGNVDPRQVARGILKKLADEVALLGSQFEDTPVAGLQDGIAKLLPDYTVDDLVSLARKFSRDVYKFNGSLNCLIENVPNPAVFRAVRAIFENSEAAVIVTIKAEQTAEVLGALDKDELAASLKVELDKLTPQKAFDLANLRWRIAKGKGTIPFDPPGLHTALLKRPRTVGKLLGTLDFMIDSKLANYPGNSLWPVDQGLAFNSDQIDENFKLFDKGQKQ